MKYLLSGEVIEAQSEVLGEQLSDSDSRQHTGDGRQNLARQITARRIISSYLKQTKKDKKTSVPA